MDTKKEIYEKIKSQANYLLDIDIREEIYGMKDDILKQIEDHNNFASNYSKELDYRIDDTNYIDNIIKKIDKLNFTAQYRDFANKVSQGNFSSLINSNLKLKECLNFHVEDSRLITVALTNFINGENSYKITAYNKTHGDIINTPGWIYMLKKNIYFTKEVSYKSPSIFNFKIEELYDHPIDLFFNEYIDPLNILNHKFAFIEVFETLVAEGINLPLVLGLDEDLPTYIICPN